MPGTTGAPMNLPYPLGAEKVGDGENAIQALAAAINTYMAPAQAGVTNGANANAAATIVLKRGGTGVASVSVQAGAAGVALLEVIFTIPLGYRPTVKLEGTVVNGSTGAALRLVVNTNGQVQAAGTIAAGQTVVGTIPLPL